LLVRQEISVEWMGKEDLPLVDEIPSSNQHLPGAGAGNSKVGKFRENNRVVRQHAIKHACLILSKKRNDNGISQ